MYGDLGRPPLRASALSRALVYDGSLWTDVRVVRATGSTNADLVAAARGGAAEGRVLVAEHQQAGRGRLDRAWVSPPQSGLTFSVLLRPPADVTPAARGWLPLLMGVAVAATVSELGEIPVGLKWPNDVLVGSDTGRGKAAGILAEVSDGAVVIGVGLNVSTRRDELPDPSATSLVLAGAACTDRDPLLRAILRRLAEDYRGWVAVAGDAVGCGLLAAYVDRCDTLGRDVEVLLPPGTTMRGRAEGIDELGRLLVRAQTGGQHPLAAGDVRHLRTPQGYL